MKQPEYEMTPGGSGGIDDGTGTGPAHHLTNHCSLGRGIAVTAAVLTRRFILTPYAMSQTLGGIRCQLLILGRHLLEMQLMFTIQTNHQADSLLVSFYLGHEYCFLGARVTL